MSGYGGTPLPAADDDLPMGTILTVWERHPVEGVKEQPIHFVRKSTELRKQVEAIGLEDSKEWHREHYKEFMHGEPWDRAILVGCKKHYEDLKNEFPTMKHYWEDPDATFGEQLLVDGFDADSICLGDVIATTAQDGAGLELQVTCPRLCCFRVDHRFPAIPPIKHSGHKGTVRQFCSSNGRAGFLCRVLRPGFVKQADQLRVIKRPHPEYPLSYLASLCYKESPLAISFDGTDKQLLQLCDMNDLCMMEWRERLIDYKAHLAKELPITAPDSMGRPVPYEEGLQLIVGEWCTLGSAGHGGSHERLKHSTPLEDEDTDYIRKIIGDVVKLTLEGDQLHTDKALFEKKHWKATVRNDEGNFAIEASLGGFPSFPRYAFMSRVGQARGVIYLFWSTGGKWFKATEF